MLTRTLPNQSKGTCRKAAETLVALRPTQIFDRGREISCALSIVEEENFEEGEVRPDHVLTCAGRGSAR